MVLIGSLHERVVIKAEYLQLIFQLLKVSNRFLQISNLVRPKRKDVEVVELVKALNFHNFILVKGEVF